MKKKDYKLIKVIIVFFLIILIISISYLMKDINEYQKNTKLAEVLIERAILDIPDTNENHINWQYLNTVNKDIIGWIQIDGTKINYPILKDNDLYYLKHSYNNEINSNGSIFTNTERPFNNEETIIYGHNMRNGLMFSEIGNYMYKDFFETHKNIIIYTPTQNYVGEIFSIYSISINEEINNIKNLSFKDRVNYYKYKSEFYINDNNNINKIIKLSTCSYINAKESPTEQRYYLIAKLNQI